ncbi:MAG: amidohydrolase family protein [Candidatus Binatia bacterium]|nr:amidohydrolase family protein [Candidatus Binatia bacterium]
MSDLEPVISADSHICEIEACYDDIDPDFRDRRPKAIFDEQAGAVLEISDLGLRIPMGLVCTGGRPPEDFGRAVPWEEIHPAGFDPAERLAIQDAEGVRAEVLYPSLGMILCNHPDVDYKKACFDAYNRWLASFCEKDPQRLLGVGQATVRTIDEGIEELRAIKAQGFRSVMLPGDPSVEDYDHPCYDPLWEACIDLGLPVSFHILTTKDGIMDRVRGNSNLVRQINTVRGVQNIVMVLILGGVFDRHPDLRVICVEADAGWVPHFKFRLDHAYERHRHHLSTTELARMPGEYMDENVYVTFQDDYSVKHVRGGLEMSRVLWATDFPHSDGTYPYTRKVIDEVTDGLDPADRNRLLRGNAAALYEITY